MSGRPRLNGLMAALACLPLASAPLRSAVPDRATWPLVARQACGAGPSPAATEMATLADGSVQVLCPSVERVANRAVRVRQACRQGAGQWRCEPLGREFTLDINGHSASVLYPLELDSWVAYQMVQAMAPLTIPLAQAGQPRRSERCQLSGDASDPQVARMVLRCRDWTVDFVRLCNATGCRHELASRISNAQPRHVPRSR